MKNLYNLKVSLLLFKFFIIGVISLIESIFVEFNLLIFIIKLNIYIIFYIFYFKYKNIFLIDYIIVLIFSLIFKYFKIVNNGKKRKKKVFY